METRGISISQMARDTNCARPYIHAVMKGENVPTIAWIQRICDYLDLELQVVMRPGKAKRVRRSA